VIVQQDAEIQHYVLHKLKPHKKATREVKSSCLFPINVTSFKLIFVMFLNQESMKELTMIKG
jgi:hypothetical protein